MRIGLMGGTFNPIHLGHLIMCEYIRMDCNLDKVIFIPSSNPPHKDKSQVMSVAHRYDMVQLAIEDNPYFEVSSIEMDRQGNSYTIDTIEELKTQYKDDEFYFIIGGDNLHELIKWKDASKLLKTTSFIVIGRQGVDEDINMLKIKEYEEVYNAKIHYLNAPLIEISSTTIRDYLKEGKSIRYMVPKKVEDYIMLHKLYRSEE